MECIQCGAVLREGALFCNSCGARQPKPEAPQPTPPEHTSAPTPSQPDTEGGRAKRPPRVPRDSDTTDTEADNVNGQHAVATDLLPPLTDADIAGQMNGARPEPDLPDAEQEPSTSNVPDVPEATLADFLLSPPSDGLDLDQPGLSSAAISTPSHPQQSDEPEAPTSDQAAPADSSQPEVAVMPPLEELARPTHEPATETTNGTPQPMPGDSLPWPLPVSIIVGGRYRVESVLDVTHDAQARENTYLVHDLQGYERCWSCSTNYGATAATDQFCRECGADMLARDYVMVERHITPPTPDEDPAAGTAVPAETTEANGAESGDSTSAVALDVAKKPAEAEDAGTTEIHTFTQGLRAYQVTPRVIDPPAFPRGARIIVAAATDTGQTRMGERNEDSLAALVLTLGYDSQTQPLALAVVADGLGGHANGQDASRVVVQTLTSHVLRTLAQPLAVLPAGTPVTEEGLDTVLKEAVQSANTKLCAANDKSGGDMGSTIVAALICGSTAYIANAGDSRAYLFADGELRRITTDHSLVEQLIVGGFVAPEDRYTHPKRNQIYRSLGDDPAQEPDLFVQKLQPGMRLLLCSDGLWEMVRDNQIAEMLTAATSPQQACEALVQAANENGGEDNITAVLVEVSG